MAKKIIFIIFTFSIIPHFVIAEDTYTCSATNINSMYCGLVNDSMKAQYGCTVTKNNGSCNATCTKLTKDVIDRYGSYLNMTVNDCTKNSSGTSSGGNNGGSTNPPPTDTTPAQTETQQPVTQTSIPSNSNPETGEISIIIAWIIGIITLGYACIYFRRMHTY